MPIIPFTINNSVGGFDLNRKEKLKIEVIFHKKIPANSFVSQNTVALADRIKNIVASSFKKPEYQFTPSKEDLEDVEQSKAAIKWRKKEAKKVQKEAKKERQKRKQEQKAIELQEKQDKKFEKYLKKKENKRNKK